MKISEFKLERYFAKYEFETEYLLCCSDCESFSVKEILDLNPDAKEKYESMRLGYTESKGSPQLRKNVAEIFNTIN